MSYNKEKRNLTNFLWKPEALRETPQLVHICDKKGCQQVGNFRAPKDHHLKEFYFFCKEHVAHYNAHWNYFSTMTEEEIEKEKEGRFSSGDWANPRFWEDGVFFKEDLYSQNEKQAKTPPPNEKEKEEEMTYQKACQVLSLPPDFDQMDIAKSYRQLAKKHHPDTNQGSQEAEKRFKSIAQAYAYLKEYAYYK